jgi:ribosomal protein S1/(E)-4-hydroxy-3-methyl-but-2-enyl pyrophosphate reductase
LTVIIAKNCGFCFGVRQATETLERIASEASKVGGAVYTYGDVIHNKQYSEKMRAAGVITIGRDDILRIIDEARSGRNVTILVRAHGITKEETENLLSAEKNTPNFSVVDCTCPIVKRAQAIAQSETNEDTVFILIGAAEHPEVRGIVSYARSKSFVFSSSGELLQFLSSDDASFLENKTIIIAGQTTLTSSEWEKSKEIIANLYTNVKIFDTICTVTDKRQREAEEIAAKADAMLIIGGANSSNTRKLYEICASRCPLSFHIETKDDIPSDLLKNINVNTVGITAGTSTPDSIIEEVARKMTERKQMNETFEELLNKSFKTLNPGDIVIGVVTSVTANEVHLDLGVKSTGIITQEQFSDDPSVKLTDVVKVGDEIKAYVIKVSDVDGIAMLSKRRVDADANWACIVDAEKEGTILEGTVTEAVKGGVVMNVNSVRVFVPAALTGVPKDGDLSSLVGTKQRVKIKEANKRGKRAYGSIRDALRAERKARENEFWNSLEVGKKFTGAIKSITPYGVFVDLGTGIDGMVHMSELTWHRIHHPSEVVSVGNMLDVHVIDFDRERRRISLSCKTEENNPWTIFKNKYSVGDVVNVKIVSFTLFGAFAEVVPGQDGLIHISEISDKRISMPSEVLKIGQNVDAKIIDINNEKKNISLSIRALLDTELPITDEDDSQTGGLVYSSDSPEDSVT